MIILLETWSREDTHTHTPLNYRELCIPSVKHPHTKHGRDSGGIIIWFKEHFLDDISPEKKGTTHIWLKLKREIVTSDQDIYLCAIYIPPTDSPYYCGDYFQTLQSEILHFQSMGSVLPMGDMNARTGKEVDYIDSMGDKYLYNTEIPRHKFLNTRQSYDCMVNSNGKQVLQLCKGLGLYIVNGRTKDDSLGRFTYCSSIGSSTVDYTIQ